VRLFFPLPERITHAPRNRVRPPDADPNPDAFGSIVTLRSSRPASVMWYVALRSSSVQRTAVIASRMVVPPCHRTQAAAPVRKRPRASAGSFEILHTVAFSYFRKGPSAGHGHCNMCPFFKADNYQSTPTELLRGRENAM